MGDLASVFAEVLAGRDWSWQGQSGQWYRFRVHTFFSTIPNSAGVYIMTRRLSYQSCSAIYIGEAERMNERLVIHEKLPIARSNGMDEIHTIAVGGGEYQRKLVERDLIQGHPTLLNQHHNALLSPLAAALMRRG